MSHRVLLRYCQCNRQPGGPDPLLPRPRIAVGWPRMFQVVQVPRAIDGIRVHEGCWL